MLKTDRRWSENVAHGWPRSVPIAVRLIVFDSARKSALLLVRREKEPESEVFFSSSFAAATTGRETERKNTVGTGFGVCAAGRGRGLTASQQQQANPSPTVVPSRAVSRWCAFVVRRESVGVCVPSAQHNKKKEEGGGEHSAGFCLYHPPPTLLTTLLLLLRFACGVLVVVSLWGKLFWQSRVPQSEGEHPLLHLLFGGGLPSLRSDVCCGTNQRIRRKNVRCLLGVPESAGVM